MPLQVSHSDPEKVFFDTLAALVLLLLLADLDSIAGDHGKDLEE